MKAERLERSPFMQYFKRNIELIVSPMAKRIMKYKQNTPIGIKPTGFGINVAGEDGSIISTDDHGNCLFCWQGDPTGVSFIDCKMSFSSTTPLT